MSTIGYYICVPFAWILRTFYELTGSYGWALVLFTLVVKLITLPFQMKSKKSMMRMNLFQPKMKEIQTKYANNPQRMNEEMQLLYTQEGVNPMSGCLWSFLPFPILIALYSIIRQPLSRFMLLSKDVVTEITSLATTLGYNAESVRVGYEEIGLAKFISDNFSEFAGKFDGLLNVNYNFLGLDLTVMQGVHGRQRCRRRQRRHRPLQPHDDVDDAGHVPVDRLYAARGSRRLLDRQLPALRHSGKGSDQVL